MSELSRPADLPRARVALAKGRLVLRRLRLARWALALVTGVVASLWLTGVAADAERARERWSATGAVWVLAVDLPSGTELETAHVVRRTLPEIAIPPSALSPSTADSPAGRRLRVDGHRGEILLIPRLAPVGASAVAARLPDGTRGVAVTTDEDEPFAVGDRADLFDLLTSRRISEAALVVDVAPGTTTFAVTVEQTNVVVEALGAGGIVAALVP